MREKVFEDHMEEEIDVFDLKVGKVTTGKGRSIAIALLRPVNKKATVVVAETTYYLRNTFLYYFPFFSAKNGDFT